MLKATTHMLLGGSIYKKILIIFLGVAFPLFSYASPKPIIIAIFDSGIDTTHPLLQNHLWTNAQEIADNNKDDDLNGIINDIHGVNWISNDNDISDFSPHGHGTHISGLVLGIHKTISSDIKIMTLKMDPFNPGLSLLKSLNYAETHGALLFNITFSQHRVPLMTLDEIRQIPQSEYEIQLSIMNQFYKHTAIIQTKEDFVYYYDRYQYDFWNIWNQAMEKIKSLQNKMLIIASSGNNSLDLNNKDYEPATYSSSNIISVLNLNEKYLPFIHPKLGTNFGSQKILVGAIGTKIRNTVPGGGFEYFTGSSQAAAKITHECAKIAIELQQNHSSPTPQRIKQILLERLPTSNILKQYTMSGKYLAE